MFFFSFFFFLEKGSGVSLEISTDQTLISSI